MFKIFKTVGLLATFSFNFLLNATPLKPRVFFSTIKYVTQTGSGSKNGSSWANAWGEAEMANNLYNQPAGTDVWIAAGIYKPTKDINGNTVAAPAPTFSVPAGVRIYGGFAGTEALITDRVLALEHGMNNTILSGDVGTIGLQTDNVNTVVTISNVSQGEVLDGITVSNGKVSGIAMSMAVTVSVNPIINNCIISDNYSSGPAALTISNGSMTAVPVISHCIFTGNQSSTGGAVKISSGKPSFDNCVFYNNSTVGQTYTAASCINFVNTAGTISNCSFIANTYAPAILMTNVSDSIYINNSVFWSNLDGYIPGFTEGSPGLVCNLKLNGGLNKASVKYCLYQTGYGITTNSGTAPATLQNSLSSNNYDNYFADLTDPDGADNIFGTNDDGLVISACNVLYDFGSNSLIASGNTLDVTDRNRIVGAAVEPGAYESQQTSGNIIITTNSADVATCPNTNAVFSVASSSANLNYQWQELNNSIWSDLINNATYNGVNTDSLHIVNVSSVISGRRYRCIISNSVCSKTSNAALLTVYNPVAVTTQPFNRFYCANSFVFLSVVATGNSLTYQWQENTGTSWSNLVNNSNYAGVTTATVNLINATASYNNYKYRCIINGNCSSNDTSNAATISLFTSGVSRIYVDSSKASGGNGLSWSTAFRDVNSALSFASCPGNSLEIWVAKGIYYPLADSLGNPNPADVRNKLFYIKSTVKIYGGFAGTETDLSQRDGLLINSTNQTILSGDIDGTPSDYVGNSYHVVVTGLVDSTTLLDGFTIEKGNANGTGNAAYGGGVYCISANANSYLSRPSFNNCLIRFNKAVTGGGINNEVKSSAIALPRITNCTFYRDSAGVGGAMCGSNTFYFNSGVPVILNISNSVFIENQSNASGGALFLNSTSLGANTLGMNLWNNIFKGNRSGKGGAVCYASTSQDNVPDGSYLISSCVFDSNYSTLNGGAIYNIDAKLKVNNSTFNNNKTAGTGGAIYHEQASDGFTTVTNSIFWNNVAGINVSNVEASNVAVVTVKNSVFPAQTATSPATLSQNINADPFFINAGNAVGADGIWRTADDGLQLSAASPCKDKGVNDYIAGISNSDFTGMFRVKGCRVDMGAYEIQSAPYNPTGLYNGNQQTCTQYPVFANNTTYIDTVNCNTMASVQSSGSSAVNGVIQVCVSNDSTVKIYNGQLYLQRHYTITPSNNATGATARVTIFYTQQDFDNYNLVADTFPKLPTSPVDSSGISNIRIEQDHGLSLTAVPGSYNGSTVFINPDDSSIIWNAANGIWEISFNVSGFSGFFMYTRKSIPICPGSSALFASRLSGTSYQWQVNSGTGYSNISDNGVYTATHTDTIHLNNPPTSFYGNKYRCVVTGSSGISYSEEYTITFAAKWLESVNGNWENPENWSCGIMPDENTDVIINNGTVFLNSATSVRSLIVKPAVMFTAGTAAVLTIKK